MIVFVIAFVISRYLQEVMHCLCELFSLYAVVVLLSSGMHTMSPSKIMWKLKVYLHSLAALLACLCRMAS